jgi:hypothetical protein
MSHADLVTMDLGFRTLDFFRPKPNLSVTRTALFGMSAFQLSPSAPMSKTNRGGGVRPKRCIIYYGFQTRSNKKFAPSGVLANPEGCQIIVGGRAPATPPDSGPGRSAPRRRRQIRLPETAAPSVHPLCPPRCPGCLAGGAKGHRYQHGQVSGRHR